MSPIGVAGFTGASNAIYLPSSAVRVRALSMANTYEALGRIVDTLSNVGRGNETIESVAWDQFKASAQQLTGDMRRVRSHYGNAVEEFTHFVEESARLHGEVASLVGEYNQTVSELQPLRAEHARALREAQPMAHEIVAAVTADPVGGAERLQQQAQDAHRNADQLLARITELQARATERWNEISAAEQSQQQLADAAAAALAGARDVSGLNDGFFGNLAAFVSGLLDIVISVLKVIVVVLLIVLTLITVVLTPIIGPAPAVGMVFLTVLFVSGVLFIAQVVRAALAGLDFGALMAAVGAAALHFGAVVVGAFLGGIAGAFVKGLLGSLGPVIAGTVAATVNTAVREGVTNLVDNTLVDEVLTLGGDGARELYDELVNSGAGAALAADAGAVGSGLAEATGASALAEGLGSSLAGAVDPLIDAASDAVTAINDVGRSVDDVLGSGSAGGLLDAGVQFGGDLAGGRDIGSALGDALTDAGTDWLDARVDSFLNAAEQAVTSGLEQAFETAGLSELGDLLADNGLSDLYSYGEQLAAGLDPVLPGTTHGEGPAEIMQDWMVPDAERVLQNLVTAGRATADWIGADDD